MEFSLLITAIFCACLAVSFLLSGMEAGVFALSRLRIRQQMRAGRPSARVLHDFLENPENFLWTILVGNTVANFFILGWVFVMLQHTIPNNWLLFALAYTPVIFLFYTLFDLLPKMLFQAFPNRLCLGLARPFQVVHWVLRPLVGLVESISDTLLRWRGGSAFTGRLFGNREELRIVMQDSAQAFSSEERAMINRVLDLQSLTVSQAMKPLEKTVTVDSNSSIGQVLELCREKNLSRFPVWESRERQRRIVGLVTCNTLLFHSELDPARSARDFIRPALYLDEGERLEVALRRMQKSGQRLAIVLGRDRREIGILSLQDVLKVVFGEVSL